MSDSVYFRGGTDSPNDINNVHFSKRIRIDRDCHTPPSPVPTEGVTSVPSPSRLRSDNLACQALSIVLQKWMIPDLGWGVQSLQEDSMKLREELYEYQYSIIDAQTHYTEERRSNAYQIIKDKLLNNSKGYDNNIPIFRIELHAMQSIFRTDIRNQLPTPLTVSTINDILIDTILMILIH